MLLPAAAPHTVSVGWDAIGGVCKHRAGEPRKTNIERSHSACVLTGKGKSRGTNRGMDFTQENILRREQEDKRFGGKRMGKAAQTTKSIH